MEQKEYIIVGDNNFWYADIDCKPSQLDKEIAKVMKDVKKGAFEDNNAEMLYVFEAKQITRVNLQ